MIYSRGVHSPTGGGFVCAESCVGGAKGVDIDSEKLHGIVATIKFTIHNRFVSGMLKSRDVISGAFSALSVIDA